jgi:hypothetical protein
MRTQIGNEFMTTKFKALAKLVYRGLTVLMGLCSFIHAAPIEHVSYRRDVMPVLTKLGCNSGPCHGNLTGKGGLKLSLRGEDPANDWYVLTHSAAARRVSPNDPESSLLLAKPAGHLPHEGGIRLSNSDHTYQILKKWIAEGAKDDAGQGPQLITIEVTPSELWSNFGEQVQKQLQVLARWSDGKTTDVTQLASFDINDPSGASISAAGLFRAERAGEWVVGVRYLGSHGVSRMVFYEDHPEYTWNGPESNNPFDQAIFKKLKRLKVNPSEPASEDVLLRRLYLDLLGILPTPDEIRSYREDQSVDRYQKRVDQLLSRPEFADNWALKWSDLLRNEPKAMGPKGNWEFHRWLRDQFAQDRPMTEFAKELITTTGSTWTAPASSFHRTSRDPETAAETFAQVFLGYRFQCAKCHNHPSDVWTQNDYYGLAATFANLRRKDINNIRRDRFDKHEVNGDVVVYFQGRPEINQPRSGELLIAKPPGGEPLPVSAKSPEAALEHLAEWLTVENRQFSRNLANRVWFQLMGRGVVEPVDDFRDSNPPSNPELLDKLQSAFEQGGYRLKPLARKIVTSAVYKLGSEPAMSFPAVESDFGRATTRLLPAEVLRDIVDQATGFERKLPDAPQGLRASQLAAANSRGEEFLKVFGKPERLLSCECERSEETTLAQAFQLINGETIKDALEADNNRISHLLKLSQTQPEQALTELFLASLSRNPTKAELDGLKSYLETGKDRRQAWEDIVWATLNAKEFLFRH